MHEVFHPLETLRSQGIYGMCKVQKSMAGNSVVDLRNEGNAERSKINQVILGLLSQYSGVEINIGPCGAEARYYF